MHWGIWQSLHNIARSTPRRIAVHNVTALAREQVPAAPWGPKSEV